jgi:hypothetical protein
MDAGFTDVKAWFTATQLKRVDWRATGSLLSGLAMSWWYASQSERHQPDDAPVAAIR